MIAFEHISKSFVQRGTQIDAVGDINLQIEPGEFVCIVGPSGCGKSTLLHMLAGFTKPSSGSISVAGNEVSGSLTKGLGYLFQKDTVLQWYTVAENVALGLKFRNASKNEIKERVEQLLKIGRLTDFADAYPYQLSGGMRRRLALLMSLACEPQILLLDEPFGALDTHTRTNLHRELLAIWLELKQTMILVTHDLDEAITLANRVIVLSGPPSTVLLDERIDIPHPRDVYSVKSLPAFTRHYQNIWAVLGEQFRSASDL
jgi:NitT/TauT family transport system ATP-binding protein